MFEHPLHPYTQALVSAVPVPDPTIEKTRKRIVLTGELPSATETFQGCPFAARCPLFAQLGPEQRQRCLGERPLLAVNASRPGDHMVDCHFA